MAVSPFARVFAARPRGILYRLSVDRLADRLDFFLIFGPPQGGPGDPSLRAWSLMSAPTGTVFRTSRRNSRA